MHWVKRFYEEIKIKMNSYTSLFSAAECCCKTNCARKRKTSKELAMKKTFESQLTKRNYWRNLSRFMRKMHKIIKNWNIKENENSQNSKIMLQYLMSTPKFSKYEFFMKLEIIRNSHILFKKNNFRIYS